MHKKKRLNNGRIILETSTVKVCFVKKTVCSAELMQTEMHHVRTLKIMLHVYARELKENLQMDSSRLDCLFPRLENLLDLHTQFLSRLKERRRENLVSPSTKNYTINRVADILIAQVGRSAYRSAITLGPLRDGVSCILAVPWMLMSFI